MEFKETLFLIITRSGVILWICEWVINRRVEHAKQQLTSFVEMTLGLNDAHLKYTKELAIHLDKMENMIMLQNEVIKGMIERLDDFPDAEKARVRLGKHGDYDPAIQMDEKLRQLLRDTRRFYQSLRLVVKA